MHLCSSVFSCRMLQPLLMHAEPKVPKGAQLQLALPSAPMPSMSSHQPLPLMWQQQQLQQQQAMQAMQFFMGMVGQSRPPAHFSAG